MRKNEFRHFSMKSKFTTSGAFANVSLYTQMVEGSTTLGSKNFSTNSKLCLRKPLTKNCCLSLFDRTHTYKAHFSSNNSLYEDIIAARAVISQIDSLDVTTLVGLDLNFNEICMFEDTTNKSCSLHLGDLILFFANSTNTTDIVQGIINHISMFRTI